MIFRRKDPFFQYKENLSAHCSKQEVYDVVSKRQSQTESLTVNTGVRAKVSVGESDFIALAFGKMVYSKLFGPCEAALKEVHDPIGSQGILGKW